MKILFIISWIFVSVLWTRIAVSDENYGFGRCLLTFLGSNILMCAFAAIIVLITVLIKFGISISF